MEAELVTRHGIAFVGLPGGGLHGVRLRTAVRNGWDLARASFVARRHLKREQPAAILTTGGYVSGPVALAARWAGVPLMVFLPDVEPAQSVRFVGSLAQRVATTVEDSASYFAGDKAVATGYPLGPRITQWDRETGREALDLPPEARVLLVFGGSRGARSINRALLANVTSLVEWTHVVHITGTLDWPEVEAARQELPDATLERYRAFSYLHDRMGAALAAADLVISRSGAGTLGEFPYFGLPAILVPYPYAWRYQKVNAQWLVDRGAAVIVEDADLEAQMLPVVRQLVESGARLAEMSQAARSLARPDAAKRVAEHLLALAQKGGRRGTS
jgi:UDP-N-acetylglucosamine--N-acetylmuramyl-(pentapeptide) pyrophosphoryl-undecaprenol N-acetylglucosamine transferase